ncbi:hypothetical protein SH467x_000546 [Pirellulaceae bacterium SH467]
MKKRVVGCPRNVANFDAEGVARRFAETVSKWGTNGFQRAKKGEGVASGEWRVASSEEHGAWSMEHGAWSMEHGAWSMGHGAGSMGQGAWGMERGIMSNVLLFLS